MFKEMGDIIPFKTVIYNIYGRAFDHIQKADLVALPVCADGIVKRNLPGMLFAGTQHHEKLVINAAGGICGKLGGTAGIKGGDRFDKTYGADGDQIIRIFITALIFFCNVCHQA